jgi:hypothetical protein
VKRFRHITPAAITATELASSACLGVLLALASAGRAEDWPMQGRDKTRNAVSPEKGAPVEWDVSKEKSLLFTHRLGEGPINSSPIFANGVLYIAANGELFAIQQGASSPPPENPAKP